MQKTRDHPNSRSGYVKEDVLKAISGFFIILAFIAVISLFAGMGGSSGGTSNSGSSDSKVIFVVNDMLLEAPKDTTWEEFVSNESLNTPGFTIQDNNVYLGDSIVIDSETNLPVTPDTPIGSDVVYKDESFVEDSGGDNNGNDDSGNTNPNNLISFTIGGTTYQAEEGMTWGEWCESDYNTGGYYEEFGSSIYRGSLHSTSYRISTDGILSGIVKPSEYITAGAYKEYAYTSSGGGAD